MSDPSQSMAEWIEGLREGDEDAAARLWHRYFSDLVQVARSKLQTTSRRVVDEEDVALSAIESFCRAAQRGRFPDLRDTDNLWKVLSEMTRRKAVDQVRRNRRLKSADDRIRGESAFVGTSGSGATRAREPASGDPTPDLAAALAEDCRRLLEGLEDPVLEQIALAKLEGFTNKEIAARCQCTERTVERRIRLIRVKWEAGDEP